MNQAGLTTKKISPYAGVAAAGVAVGAAGVWAWRRKSPTATPTPEREASAEKPDGSTTPAPTPTPAPDAEMQHTGPMVAVYLDNESVEKLHREYPGANPGRLRKAVIQYNPSADQRSLYERHFGGSATVKLTGEASSENRLALTASVSSAGGSVEPQSLSCAVDVTPGGVGGGPLGSTVLIEQIKRAGALTEESWKGQLPALSAHERDFSTEEGSFNKLDEPLTLQGSICRADWVEGKSGFCRTTAEGGGKREDGWTPQVCPMCNTFEASPCRDIYKIFDRMSKRINELQPPKESESQSQNPSAESSSGTPSEASSAEDNERGAFKNESRSESNDAAEKSSLGGENAISSGEGKGSIEGKSKGKGPQESKGEEPETETEDEKLRREEVDMLKFKRVSIMQEMLTCSQFHHVFEDLNADDGLVPGMPDEEVEGGEDATSGTGSGAGEGESSGVATEGKKAGEGGEQPPAAKSAEK